MIVYVLRGKRSSTKIGFTDDWGKTLKKATEEDKTVQILLKESYTSKKNALIRVKQLKKQLIKR